MTDRVTVLRRFAMLLALAALPARAAEPILVSEAWIRATPPGMTSAAAYLVLSNREPVPDRLVAASSDASSEVMAHVTVLENGVLKMQDAPLSVAAHGRVVLAPQGSHLMLMGLKAPLVPGAVVTLKLRFEHAGQVVVRVPVVSATADGP